ncbi:MAG TPA: hypothetical protein DCG68_00455 [Cryomorphaceae bacterium]|nr:hypothetical protein [Cryomorphaceae bacterium]
MAFNGAGVFVIDSTGQPVVSATTISSSVFNAFTADVATGLSTCITKDGQQTVTANIPFGGFKLTGVGAATARTDAATLASIQDGTGVYVATVGGTADVITLTPSPAITAYTAGQTFRFLSSGANTTNVTVNISALGAKDITKNGTTALAAGDIPSGMMVGITYDGTQFILIGTATLNSAGLISGRAYTAVNSVSYSATPTIDASLSNYHEVGDLTGNITTLTISNAAAGQTITIRFKQDGTGGYTVATPSGAKISGSVDTTASVVSHLTLTYSLADSRWEGYYSTVPV